MPSLYVGRRRQHVVVCIGTGAHKTIVTHRSIQRTALWLVRRVRTLANAASQRGQTHAPVNQPLYGHSRV